MSSSRVCHHKCPEKYFHKKTLTETTLKQKFEEKFKSKASLKYLRSWKCYEEVTSFDANTVTHFTSNYKNNTCHNFVELWDKGCEKIERKINQNLEQKRGLVPESPLLKIFAILYKKLIEKVEEAKKKSITISF